MCSRKSVILQFYVFGPAESKSKVRFWKTLIIGEKSNALTIALTKKGEHVKPVFFLAGGEKDRFELMK